MVKDCPQCGTQSVDDSSLFCIKCGAKLPSTKATEVQKTCLKCGNKITDGNAIFCSLCGFSLAPAKKVVLKSHNLSEDDNGLRSEVIQKNIHKKSYQSNIVLIIAFFLVLLLILINTLLASLVIILSAIAVYQDAKSIGAGNKSKNEKDFDTLTWSPGNWALCVLLLWFIGHPLYLIKRQEIFYLNNPETAPINQIESRDIKTVINQLPENKTIKAPPVIKSPENPVVTTKHPLSLLFQLIGLSILIWVLISFLGVLGVNFFNFGAILHSNSDSLITQDLPSMALTINDLPSGWVSQGGKGTANLYSIEFVKPVVYSPGMVDLSITRYTTIENAKREYNSLLAQAPNVKIETINLGNEGFGYINFNDAWVIFRRGNIVVKIEDVRNEYEYLPTINNAKKFAEIVANKIK